MSNQEKQADEILVLQSMFDQQFRLRDDNQYEISIDFELLTPITLRLNDRTATIRYLPPFTLLIHYHEEYPSTEPPSFLLSCFYFSQSRLQKLGQKLDHYPFQGEVCVYDWIDLIKREIDDEFILDTDIPKQENDPRALNGYSNEAVDNIFQTLIHYNQEYLDKQFVNQLQTCLVCTETLPGRDCIRLHRCGHFYCQICLNNYVQTTLNNGQFGEKLHCPQSQCQQPLLPTEVRQTLQNDQLYDRYERLTLQHSLALMSDITWCPRCQSAVLMEDNAERLGICYQCRYTFCRTCRETFHSQTICPKDYLIDQLRLQREKEQVRLRKQQEEARARLIKLEQGNKSAVQQDQARETYRQIVIKLSEKDALLEEILNAERMDSLNTQRCPQCLVRIEKNGGCSHMHCSQCNTDFTWQAVNPTAQSSIVLFLNKNTDTESINEELYGLVNTVERSTSETNEEDVKISIDNRSIIGSAIVKRVKGCPSKSCKKPNVKVGQDNWIVCTGCMKQFCFLCGHSINGEKHFEKKCQRYTAV